MIRVSISSKNNQMIQQSFEQFFQKEHLEYCIVPYQKQTHQDIYIFEIQNKEKQTFYFKKENLMFFDFFTKNIIK